MNLNFKKKRRKKGKRRRKIKLEKKWSQLAKGRTRTGKTEQKFIFSSFEEKIINL